MWAGAWEGPCAGVGGGERVGTGGGLAGEMGRDANDEGIVLVLLVEDGELDGEVRSRLDRVIKRELGRGDRALAGHLGRLGSAVRLLPFDALRPDVDLWGF